MIKKVKPQQITVGVVESGKWFNQTDESCCGVAAVLNLYKWYEPKKKINNRLIQEISQKTAFSHAGIYPELLHKYLEKNKISTS